MTTEKRIEALNARINRFEIMLDEQIFKLSGAMSYIQVINTTLNTVPNRGDVYVSFNIYCKILPYQNRVKGRVIRNLWLTDDSFLIS